MSILTRIRPNVQNHLFTSTDRAVAALRRELDRLNYNPAYSREICQIAFSEGCLLDAYDAGLIDGEDYESLTELFAASFDEVHPSSPKWNDASRWEAPIPTAEESRAYAEMMGTFDPNDCTSDADLLVPPPDLEPEPLTNWDEFARWSTSLEASHPDRYLEVELAEAGIRR